MGFYQRMGDIEKSALKMLKSADIEAVDVDLVVAQFAVDTWRVGLLIHYAADESVGIRGGPDEFVGLFRIGSPPEPGPDRAELIDWETPPRGVDKDDEVIGEARRAILRVADRLADESFLFGLGDLS